MTVSLTMFHACTIFLWLNETQLLLTQLDSDGGGRADGGVQDSPPGLNSRLWLGLGKQKH